MLIRSSVAVRHHQQSFLRTPSTLSYLQPSATPLHSPVPDKPFFGDSTDNKALLCSPPSLRPPSTYCTHCNPRPQTTRFHKQTSRSRRRHPKPRLTPLSVGLTVFPQTACAIRTGIVSNVQAVQSAKVLAELLWMCDACWGGRAGGSSANSPHTTCSI
jgi:hypothetical protein